MREMFVRGMGIWTPRFSNIASWRANTEKAEKPACSIAHSRLKRGTSQSSRIAIEVASQAVDDAGFSLNDCAMVFASAYGELNIAIAQLRMMRTGDGIVSPAMFKNSVHNTAAGVFAIAAKNRGFTTALAAGDHSLGAALMEAYALLATGEREVVVALADESLPEPLLSQIDGGKFESLGVSFALSLERGLKPWAEISGLGPVGGGAAMPVKPGLRANPVSAALGLLERIHHGPAGRCCLSNESAQMWSLDLEPLA